jgi:hypothetical protein
MKFLAIHWPALAGAALLFGACVYGWSLACMGDDGDDEQQAPEAETDRRRKMWE